MRCIYSSFGVRDSSDAALRTGSRKAAMRTGSGFFFGSKTKTDETHSRPGLSDPRIVSQA